MFKKNKDEPVTKKWKRKWRIISGLSGAGIGATICNIGSHQYIFDTFETGLAHDILNAVTIVSAAIGAIVGTYYLPKVAAKISTSIQKSEGQKKPQIPQYLSETEKEIDVCLAKAQKDYNVGMTELENIYENDHSLSTISVQKKATVFLNLANYCQHRGDIEKAVDYFEKELLINPGDTYARGALDSLKLNKNRCNGKGFDKQPTYISQSSSPKKALI